MTPKLELPAQDPHQIKLLEAAPSLGIIAEDLREIWGMDAIRYHLGTESRLVFDGRAYPSLTAEADIICNDKHITKTYFEKVGLPFPKSKVFRIDPERLDIAWLGQALSTVFHEGGTFVCKPLLGTDGHAVGMNLETLEAIQAHILEFAAFYSVWMLEVQVEGDDLRIQVIGGRIAAACIRIPARVIGNGKQSLSELIEAHNAKIQSQNPGNYLEIDGPTRQLMQEQAVELGSVITKDREIQLKYVSNMGQGGIAIDVSEQLHPLYHQWAADLSASIGIQTYALDLMCNNPELDPQNHANGIELNPRAQWLHHTFSEVKQHDIPTMILQDLFAEG